MMVGSPAPSSYAPDVRLGGVHLGRRMGFKGFFRLVCGLLVAASSSGVRHADGAGPASHPKGSEATLLLMNPSPKTLRDFVFLIENRVIDLPGYRVVALYHANAKKRFLEAQTYRKKYPRPWLELRKAKCQVSLKDVFRDNACRRELEGWVSKSKAMIFTGGTDLLPALYGEPTRLTTQVKHPKRNIFEVSALHHLLGSSKHQTGLLEAHPDYAVLAICLGMQTMNVALGGTLYQDVPTEIYGSKSAQDVLKLPPEQQHACYAHQVSGNAPRQLWTTHPTRFDDAWDLGTLPSSRTVNTISFHHQAVDKLGSGLRVVATSVDGKVVEGVEHDRFSNVVGVQFHPEYAKAWTAHPHCQTSLEGPRFEIQTEMGSFYRSFWSSWSARLRASSNREPAPPVRVASQDSKPTTGSVAQPDEAPSVSAPTELERARERARRRMLKGLSVLGDRRPRACGVLGQLSSPITSKIGLRSSKMASCDPEFAAVLVDLFNDAGLQSGDAVGVALSGSFPALNLATIVASEALRLKPVVVSSLSSSMFGANRPDQTWVDMESHLLRAGVIHTRSEAVTLGGRDDNGAGLAPEGIRLLRAAAERNPVPLLETPSLPAAIDARLQLYRKKAGPRGLKAFVNVGGGKASFGTPANKKRFRPGLNVKPPRHLDPTGVMSVVSRDGLPVIYLGNIRRLCRSHGMTCFSSDRSARPS